MKKLLTMLMLAVMSFGTMSISSAMAAPFQTVKHLKKDGTPDKRFKENKKPKGPVTKSGKPDMRYKANNPKAGKKKK